MKAWKKMTKLRKGLVLILVAAAIAVMMIMSVAMARLGFQSRILAVRDSQEVMARAAADAGLERAIFELTALKSSWPSDNTIPMEWEGTLPGTNQSYTVTATFPQSDPLFSSYAPYIRDIVSIGRSGTSSPKERKVIATVVLESSISYGIFVQEDLTIMNGGTLDSYDSLLGEYGVGGNEGMGVKIGTNACWDRAVALKQDMIIPPESQIHVGPLEGPEAAETVLHVVSGQGDFPDEHIFSEAQTMPFTEWQISEAELSSAGPLNVDDATVYLDAGEHYYSKVDVTDDPNVPGVGKLVVRGPGEVIVNVGRDNFRLFSRTTLEVVSGAKLILKMAGDFEAKVNSEIIVVSKDPADFKLLGTEDCDKIVIKNSGDFTGVVDAGYALVQIMNTGDFYGSVTAREAEIKNSGGFHFDNNLLRGSSTDPSSRFVVVRWREGDADDDL